VKIQREETLQQKGMMSLYTKIAKRTNGTAEGQRRFLSRNLRSDGSSLSLQLHQLTSHSTKAKHTRSSHQLSLLPGCNKILLYKILCHVICPAGRINLSNCNCKDPECGVIVPTAINWWISICYSSSAGMDISISRFERLKNA
jgi:hypothetical protein